MATVCEVLGIDHTKKVETAGRPADPHRRKGAKPIDELFS